MRKLLKGNSYRVTLSEFMELAPKGLVVTTGRSYYFYLDGRYCFSDYSDLRDPDDIHGLFTEFTNVAPMYTTPIPNYHGTWIPSQNAGISLTVVQEPKHISKIRRH